MVDRFEDIFEFNLRGNYQEELRRLRESSAQAEAAWQDLKRTVGVSDGEFKTTKKALASLSAEQRKEVRQLEAHKIALEDVLSPQQALATAYARLVREQNRLTASRIQETIALEQAKNRSDPQIIQARAEARAIRAISKSLEEVATKRILAAEASKLGLKVSADGRSIFNAEAVALERIAQAAEKAAIAEELRKRGFSTAGTPLPGPAVQNGALTEAGRLTAQQQADKKIRATLLKNEELQLLKNNKAYLDAAKAGRLAQKEINLLTGAGRETESAFNRVSFTFRRLIGIMAAFTIARKVTGGFVDMIKTAVQFNAQIESSRVGLAGLIAASAEIRDPLGNKLGLDDQVLRAQDIAIDQMAKLRKEALQTAASYDELSRAFNSAVAPGIQAGLTLDQIRAITVNISQAATGLGLAQDQLAEEIRSLFSGTITARSTRIATALGISNADIANAKKLGNLFEFLSSRFAAIGKTGKLLLNTFTGQLSNTADALKQLLAVSSAPLFEQLKAGLRDVQEAVFDTSKAADNMFSEDALTAFRGLFEGLANGVKGIRSAVASVDAKAFGDAFAAVGQALGVVATSLANAFAFLVNASTPTVTAFAGIFDLLTKISIAIKLVTGEFGKFLGGVILTTARLFIMGKAIALVRGGVVRMVEGIAKVRTGIAASEIAIQTASVATKGWAASLKVAALSSLALLKPLLIVAGVVVAIDQALAFFGFDFSFIEALSQVFSLVSDKLDEAISGVDGLKEELGKPVSNSFGLVVEDFRKLRSEVEQASEETSNFLKKTSKQRESLSRSRGSPEPVSRAIQINSDQEIAAAEKALDLDKARLAFVRQVTEAQSTFLKAGSDELVYQERINKLLDTKKALQTKLAQDLQQFPGASPLGVNPFFQTLDFQLSETVRQTTEALSALDSQLTLEEISKRKAVQSQKDSNTAKKVLFDQLNDLSILRESLFDDFKRRAADEQKIVFDQDLFDLEQRLKALPVEVQGEQVALDRAQKGDTFRVAALAAQVALRKEAISLQQTETELERGILRIQELRSLEEARGPKADLELLTLLDQQLDSRGKELTLERAIGRARLQRLAAEERLAKLRESGTSTQGIGQGLNQFAAENASAFKVGEQLGQGLGAAIPTFAGDALKTVVSAAFDRTQNVDLSEAIADIGAGIAIDLASNLVSGAASNLISSLITSLGIDVIGQGAEQLSVASSAANIQTTAAATSATTQTTAALTSATTLEGGGLAAGAAILAAAAKAATQLATTSLATSGSSVGSALGGRVNDMRRFPSANLNLTHARATGYAKGGRPAGIDARDTIPAFLRPGEWVIRPEAVKLYGDRLFDLLNRGQLNPAALRGVAGAISAPSKAPRAKSGYATGGAVVQGGSPGGRQTAVGQVIQFHDEQTMERALAAGSNATVRFARSRRGAYRAALGIDPGT